MQNLRTKTLIALALIVSSIYFFTACKKSESPELPKTTEFTPEAAKEWYYGTFKKSSEYASYDVATFGVKSPDWKHGKYQKLNNLEIVEFPLIKTKGKLLIPSANRTSTELNRIAEAALSRVVFIKNGQKIIVRELEYIPDLEYASQKAFDISDNMLTSVDPHFAGRVIQKQWNNSEIARKILAEGKVIRTGHLKQMQTGEPLPTTQSISTHGCTLYEICEWTRECEYIWVGDMIEKSCDVWVQGNCWYEEYCDNNDDPCGNLSDEACACVFYAICPNDDDDPVVVCEDKFDDIMETATALAEKISVNITANGGTTRTKEYQWKVFSISGGLIPTYLISKETGTQSAVSSTVWKYNTFTHNSINVEGPEIVYTVTVQDVTATPSMYTNTTNNDWAKMYLSFNVKVTFVCEGNPFNRNKNPITQQSWHVNE